MRQAVLCSALGLVVAAFGCEPNPMRVASIRPERDYAELPGLRASEHRELRAELRRLVDERATPALMRSRRVPAEQNVAVAVADLFAPDEVELLAAQTRELAAREGLPLVGADLNRGRQFLARYAPQREKLRQALLRAECDLGLDPKEGHATDLRPIETLRLAARLEAFAASDALEQGNVAAAIRSIDSMLRLANCLAGEPNLVARLEGAHVRTEALGLAEHLVHGVELSQSDLAALARLVARELAHWPDDAHAWIGDRALGLHTYEIVRDRQIRSILDDDEIEQLEREGMMRNLRRPEPEQIDADQWFYLQAMRDIIEVCSRPYYERRPRFEQMRGQLHALRGSDAFPVVAGRLLLGDVERGHQLQAEDRARCEAWALALSRLTGQERPQYEINPRTGTPYHVAEQADRVVVWPASGPDDVLTLPRMSDSGE